MPNIQTVCPLSTKAELRHFQCHEPIYFFMGKNYKVSEVHRINDYERYLKELMTYKKTGGDLIVDAQPIGHGRDAVMLEKLSAFTEVAMVASTGFYKLDLYPKNHWIRGLSVNEFADIMISEIKEGMYINCEKYYPRDRIGAKAGMIRVACDNECLSPVYEPLFTAAARAAKETGAPIQCHIEGHGQGDLITDFLIEQGVSADQVILAHMDRAEPDRHQILKVLKKGVYLQFDTIGRFKYHSEEDEIDVMHMLCARGFTRQLLVGLDTTRARLQSQEGGFGLKYIQGTLIPKMKKGHIDLKTIDYFTHKNPAKALAMR